MEVSVNEHNLEEFLERFPLGSFMQSRFWKKFLSLQGIKNWQLSVYDDNELMAHCLLYATNLPFGKSFLYAPKGPLIVPTLTNDQKKEALELLLSQIRDITIATRRREEIFCRIEPNIPPADLSNFSMKQTEPIQPKTTIYLKISDTTPELLFNGFKEKTRYNIKLAERKGVTVKWSNDQDGLKIFRSLLNKSASRNKIKTHNRQHFELLVKAGQEHDAVTINWAEYQGKPIAANLYVLQSPTMTYLHGGFNYRYRNVMAPYLLQWEAIQYAMKHHMLFYDFMGYTPSDGSKPNWQGFSRFKEGFGGTTYETPGCFDYTYNPVWYTIYETTRRFRRML